MEAKKYLIEMTKCQKDKKEYVEKTLINAINEAYPELTSLKYEVTEASEEYVVVTSKSTTLRICVTCDSLSTLFFDVAIGLHKIF